MVVWADDMVLDFEVETKNWAQAKAVEELGDREDSDAVEALLEIPGAVSAQEGTLVPDHEVPKTVEGPTHPGRLGGDAL